MISPLLTIIAGCIAIDASIAAQSESIWNGVWVAGLQLLLAGLVWLIYNVMKASR